MRQIITLWGLAAIGIASLSLMGIDTAGFPDGYITPYDRLTMLPQTVLSLLVLIAGMFLLARGLLNRVGRSDVIIGWAMLIFLYLPMHTIENCPRWGTCRSLFEGSTGVVIDDGTGG